MLEVFRDRGWLRVDVPFDELVETAVVLCSVDTYLRIPSATGGASTPTAHGVRRMLAETVFLSRDSERSRSADPATLVAVTSTQDDLRFSEITRTAAQTRVLDAALKLIAEHGVSGTSLQMIADAMGVTKAAVYRQFKTKEEIVIAITERELATSRMGSKLPKPRDTL